VNILRIDIRIGPAVHPGVERFAGRESGGFAAGGQHGAGPAVGFPGKQGFADLDTRWHLSEDFLCGDRDPALWCADAGPFEPVQEWRANTEISAP